MSGRFARKFGTLKDKNQVLCQTKKFVIQNAEFHHDVMKVYFVIVFARTRVYLALMMGFMCIFFEVKV